MEVYIMSRWASAGEENVRSVIEKVGVGNRDQRFLREVGAAKETALLCGVSSTVSIQEAKRQNAKKGRERRERHSLTHKAPAIPAIRNGSSKIRQLGFAPT